MKSLLARTVALSLFFAGGVAHAQTFSMARPHVMSTQDVNDDTAADAEFTRTQTEALSGIHAEDRTPRVLISAFEPFGGRRENASEEVMKAFFATWESTPSNERAYDVRTLKLEVAYDIAPQALNAEMNRYEPDVVISLGESPDAQYRLEHRARNRDDTPFADNRGVVRMGDKIIPGAPDWLMSRLPVSTLRRDLMAAGLPVIESRDAGSYLCNHLFFHLMHDVTSEPEFRNVMGGFIHVPADSLASNPAYPATGARMLSVVLKRVLGL